MSPSGQSKQRAKRQGFSLVEYVLVISLISIVLAGVGPALAALVRVRHDMQRDLVLQKSIERLSRDFRDDVRRARAYNIAKTDAAVTLKLNTSISYTIRQNHLRRVLRDEDGKQMLEDYLLFPATTVEFQLPDNGEFLAMSLTSPWSSRGNVIGDRIVTLASRIGGDLVNSRSDES